MIHLPYNILIGRDGQVLRVTGSVAEWVNLEPTTHDYLTALKKAIEEEEKTLQELPH